MSAKVKICKVCGRRFGRRSPKKNKGPGFGLCSKMCKQVKVIEAELMRDDAPLFTPLIHTTAGRAQRAAGIRSSGADFMQYAMKLMHELIP